MATKNYKQYDRAAALPREVANRLVSRLDLIRIKPNVILDLGAGTGFVSQALRQKYPQASIIAVDQSEKALQFIKEKDSTVKTLIADAKALPLKAKSIDLIVSNLMLPWCKNISNIFQEIKRILTSDGLFLFTTLGADSLKTLTLTNLYFFDLRDIGNLMLQLGFIDPVTDREFISLRYSSAAQMSQELKDIDIEIRGERTVGDNLAEFEIIYGHGWGALEQKAKHSEISIPIDNIIRNDKKHGC